MGKDDRYNTDQLIENRFEEGSDGLVLKNLQGIRDEGTMARLETEELLYATGELIDYYDREHRFTAADICLMHKIWLGSLYQWAGCYRQVRMSKGAFMFAVPAFIPKLMEEFEKNVLGRYTPCIFPEKKKIIEALAVVHVELLLIHPFREGNGRLARLLAVLMGLQAELPFLDFSGIEGERRNIYFAAVRAGMDRDYSLMEGIFSDVIAYSLKIFGVK